MKKMLCVVAFAFGMVGCATTSAPTVTEKPVHAEEWRHVEVACGYVEADKRLLGSRRRTCRALTVRWLLQSARAFQRPALARPRLPVSLV